MGESEQSERTKIKDVEWRLLSELMKNSRRSDRELAKVISVSQPTVSRLIKKLEKEGLIREYTMIPCFHKIGYHLLALTFVKLARNTSPEQLDKVKQTATERLRKSPFGFILFKTGMGLGYDAVLVSFHENYASFDDLRNELKKSTAPSAIEIEVFLTSLDDEARYVPLTFSLLARHLLTLKDKQKQ